MLITLISIKAIWVKVAHAGRTNHRCFREFAAFSAVYQDKDALEGMVQKLAGLDQIAEASRYFSGPVGDPLEAIERAHAALYTLCDLLEQTADSIPSRISSKTCASLGESLLPLLRDIHQFEEDVLYPLAIHRLGATKQIRSTITRLRYEHCEDICFAEELSDALRELGGGQAPKNPDAIGYMLRGFFETLRRHIAFEREHLLYVIGEADRLGH